MRTGRPKGKTDFHILIHKHGIKDSQVADWLGLSYPNYLSSSARERYRKAIVNAIKATEVSLNKAIVEKVGELVGKV